MIGFASSRNRNHLVSFWRTVLRSTSVLMSTMRRMSRSACTSIVGSRCTPIHSPFMNTCGDSHTSLQVLLSLMDG